MACMYIWLVFIDIYLARSWSISMFSETILSFSRLIALKITDCTKSSNWFCVSCITFPAEICPTFAGLRIFRHFCSTCQLSDFAFHSKHTSAFDKGFCRNNWLVLARECFFGPGGLIWQNLVNVARAPHNSHVYDWVKRNLGPYN